MIKETKGFYNAYWRNIIWKTPNRYTMGNHRTKQEHNVAFVDGHARSVVYRVRTDVSKLGNGDQFVVHSGNWVIRGARLEQVNLDPPTYGSFYHLMFSGPGWTEHCFPAPVYKFDDLKW